MPRIRSIGLAGIAAIAAATIFAHTASAQLACTSRTEVLEHLASKYHETPVAMGVASNGGVLEVLSSKTGQSWTIIITMPSGHSCMVAAGDSWQDLPALASRDPEA